MAASRWSTGAKGLKDGICFALDRHHATQSHRRTSTLAPSAGRAVSGHWLPRKPLPLVLDIVGNQVRRAPLHGADRLAIAEFTRDQPAEAGNLEVQSQRVVKPGPPATAGRSTVTLGH